jgi:hypothetical protein
MSTNQVNKLPKGGGDGKEKLSSEIFAVSASEGLANTILRVEMEVTSYVTM